MARLVEVRRRRKVAEQQSRDRKRNSLRVKKLLNAKEATELLRGRGVDADENVLRARSRSRSVASKGAAEASEKGRGRKRTRSVAQEAEAAEQRSRSQQMRSRSVSVAPGEGFRNVKVCCAFVFLFVSVCLSVCLSMVAGPRFFHWMLLFFILLLNPMMDEAQAFRFVLSECGRCSVVTMTRMAAATTATMTATRADVVGSNSVCLTWECCSVLSDLSYIYVLMQQKVEAQRAAHREQRSRSHDARKGDADRHVYDLMPKHLYSGKRKQGTLDRR